MPEHHLITDPYIHEPKGISSTQAGMIYISDGQGSGAWKLWPLGKAFYQHGSTGQVVNTTPALLQVDGAGPLTDTSRLPREIRGSGNLWNTSQFRINPIKLGDGYTVRIDIPVTNLAGSPTLFTIDFDVGTGVAPSIIALEKYFSITEAAPFVMSFYTAFDVLTADTLVNGIELFCSVDTGTLTLGAPGIYISKVTDGDM